MDELTEEMVHAIKVLTEMRWGREVEVIVDNENGTIELKGVNRWRKLNFNGDSYSGIAIDFGRFLSE